MARCEHTSTFILRKRFGLIIQARRVDLNLTQAAVAEKLSFDWPAMVSQVERGKTALPSHSIFNWADVLQMGYEPLGRLWLYYIEPDLYAALFAADPYELEELPRPIRTVYAAPGRPPLRLLPKD